MDQVISTNSASTSHSSAQRSSFLIADSEQRNRRAEEKRRQILKLLRDEVWTVTEVIAAVLSVKYSAANTVLQAMQRDGLLSSSKLFVPSQRGAKQMTLYGITPLGLAHAWDLNEVAPARGHWEPSKTNPLFVPHNVETQLARVKAEQNGWHGWKPSRLLMNQGLPKLPDAEAMAPQTSASVQVSVAIEIEREIKTDRRLEAVVGAYISEIKNHRWDRIDYICPDADFAARLARNFGRLKQLRLEPNGKQPARSGKLEQAHLDRFRFYAADQWPNGAFITAKKG